MINNKSLHIAFVTPEYPHDSLKPSAGLGSSIKNLANGLIKSGLNVTVFVAFQNKNETLYDGGIKVISIARKGYQFFGWYLERKHIQYVVQKVISVSCIDVIEAPDWTGITAFMKFSVPLVIRLHGSDAYFCFLENRQQKWKHRFLEKQALKNANAILSVSRFTGELTKQVFKIKKDITTLYNGIDVDVFKPINVREVEGQLLYFGTIIRKKGILELAKAFNLIVQKAPTTTLLLIGKDTVDVFENVSSLGLFFSALSEAAKPQVIHLPEVTYQEINTYISKAQIVILPSFAEAFPMTWLETLAMEKALVSSNIGWAQELMVDGKTGYTIDPKNHKEFALKVLDLLNDSEKRIRFGREGRQHVIQKFSVEVVTQQNIEFYKNMIGK